MKLLDLMNKIINTDDVCIVEKYQFFSDCCQAQKYRLDERKKRIAEIDDELETAIRLNNEYVQKNQKRMKLKNSIQTENREEKIFGLMCSEESRKIIYTKYLQLEAMTRESDKAEIENWLNLVLSLPHNSPVFYRPVIESSTQELAKMRNILDSNIYGQNRVKDRLMECLARYRYAPNGSCRNIALLGDPGTGKTLIANTIAKCIDYPFYDINLGVVDYITLVGTNFTYIKAQEGEITKGMSHFYTQTGTRSGVMFFDEVDKTKGDRYYGKLVSSLINISDPKFRDKYKDEFLCGVTQDLSGVLMIFAMNEEIEEKPLASRVETIKMEKYTEQEKMKIVRNFFIPGYLKNMNITAGMICIDDECVKEILSLVTDPGVRKLESCIKKVIDHLYYLWLGQSPIKGVEITPTTVRPSADYIYNFLMKNSDNINSEVPMGLYT